MDYYNEIILITQTGSLAIRVGRQFTISRKIGKTHQNVLVFCKGDPKIAAEAIGACDSYEDLGSDDATLSYSLNGNME
jgi:hypothetical protein